MNQSSKFIANFCIIQREAKWLKMAISKITIFEALQHYKNLAYSIVCLLFSLECDFYGLVIFTEIRQGHSTPCYLSYLLAHYSWMDQRSMNTRKWNTYLMIVTCRHSTEYIFCLNIVTSRQIPYMRCLTLQINMNNNKYIHFIYGNRVEI